MGEADNTWDYLLQTPFGSMRAKQQSVGISGGRGGHGVGRVRKCVCVCVCVCVIGLTVYLFYGSLEVATFLVLPKEARLIPRAC